MAGYSTNNRLLNGTAVATVAPSTQPISSNYPITEGDTDNHMIAIKCSGTSGSVTLKLQHSWSVGEGFIDMPSATVAAANGTVIIATTGPLWPIARIVADGAGSTTIEAVYVSRRT